MTGADDGGSLNRAGIVATRRPPPSDPKPEKPGLRAGV